MGRFVNGIRYRPDRPDALHSRGLGYDRDGGMERVAGIKVLLESLRLEKISSLFAEALFWFEEALFILKQMS